MKDLMNIHIDHGSLIPKYRQIINLISDAVDSGAMKSGDPLPSINVLMDRFNLSRDTVFKSYQELKQRGLVESIPGKGYFIREAKTKVLLFLDKYSPFKEGLYNSMRQNLPENFSIDLYFHHYNIDVFENVLKSGLSRYHKFVVMSINHPKTPAILKDLKKGSLLMLDVIHGAPEHLPAVYQEFEFSFYNCLVEASDLLKKYREVVFVLRPETDHPSESATAFENFCRDFEIKAKVIPQLDNEEILKDKAYIVVSDDDLVRIVEKSKIKHYRLGQDIGIISYNDTPVKKVIAEGITVISSDFPEMGKEVAKFLMEPVFFHKQIPTRLITRSSL
jgi:DNA-binding transcriptional regulator YhcF (GntR family)